MFEKVAVTGAAGKIGSFLIDDLESRCDLTLMDCVADSGRPSILQIDVRDIEALRKLLRGHDAVVHLAAVGEDDSDRVCSVNVGGTWNVLQAAADCGLRKAVIMSSEAGLGMEYLDTDPPPLYLPIDETHPFRPCDLYGLSKQLCEAIGQNFARRGDVGSIVCLRPTEVAFPSVIEDIVGRLEQETELGVAGVTRTSADPHGLAISRAYIRPDDMVRMIRNALETETESYARFWASAADTYANQPTLAFMEELFGSLPEIRMPRRFRNHPNSAVFDIAAARDKLGWEPTGTWQDTVAEWRASVDARRGAAESPS
ncbi:MAG: NAD(P)-dependent oxidoreductase [Rhodospirillaceae bacterium]|nr:NAD(P)-dependent oxidoreductase [Rhodospirillaceae bacterium]